MIIIGIPEEKDIEPRLVLVLGRIASREEADKSATRQRARARNEMEAAAQFRR